MNTKRNAVVHLNDIKMYERPSLLDWHLNPRYKEICADQLDIDLSKYVSGKEVITFPFATLPGFMVN